MNPKLENLWQIYNSINEWIRFSDTKASLVLAIDGVFISIILSGLKDFLILVNKNSFLVFLIIIVIILLTLSLYHSVLSLIPILKNNKAYNKDLSVDNKNYKSEHLIFFGDIIDKFDDFTAYKETLDKESICDEKIEISLSEQIFINSKIANKKLNKSRNL